MTVKNVGPLDWRIGIVDNAGRPTQQFQRMWANQQANNDQINLIWAPTVATPGRKPNAGEELFNTPISFSTMLPAGLIGSIGSCEVAATADTLFTLYHNKTEIGTIRFPAGQLGNNVAIFIMTTDQNFISPTDNLSCVSPSSQDATLSGVSIQLLGSIT